MTVKERLQRMAADVPDEVEPPPDLERQLARLERAVARLLAGPSHEKDLSDELVSADEEISQRLRTLLARAHEGWDAEVGRLLAMEGGALTAEQVAARLGAGLADVRAWTEGHRLLAVERPDGTLAYPAWQFTEHGVVPGLETVLAAHRVLGPEVAIWFLSVDPQLGDRRPLDVLREGGRVRAVARAAASYGEQGAT